MAGTIAPESARRNPPGHAGRLDRSGGHRVDQYVRCERDGHAPVRWIDRGGHRVLRHLSISLVQADDQATQLLEQPGPGGRRHQHQNQNLRHGAGQDAQQTDESCGHPPGTSDTLSTDLPAPTQATPEEGIFNQELRPQAEADRCAAVTRRDPEVNGNRR